MTPRFLLDNDGSNFYYNLPEDVDLEKAVAEVVQECPPNVTTYLLCPGAGTYWYPTQVADVDRRAESLARLLEQGRDPFGMILRGLKRSGKETFITLRMNDVHNPDAADQWNTPRIRREHPDCVVAPEEIAAGNPSWMAYCLDYSREEVRAYVLSVIREMVERYGDTIDGLQLDWMRFPRHLPGDPEAVWEKRDFLTSFTAEARKILGPDRLLAARVPPTLEGCRNLGLDLAEWTRRDLVDLLVLCPFLTTNWHVPVEDFRALLGEHRVPIYAGFDFGYGSTAHHPESLRGICTSLYGCGADGIYVFNFPCWIEYLAARPYHWLAGLDNPATAAAKPLQFAVAHAHNRHLLADGPGEIPATLPANGTLEVSLYVPDAALPAWRALFLVHSHGDVQMSLNGQPTQPRQQHPDETSGSDGHRSEIFLEFADQYWQKDARPKPQDCRAFQADPSLLRPGFNRITLTNAAGTDLEIERVHLALW